MMYGTYYLRRFFYILFRKFSQYWLYIVVGLLLIYLLVSLIRWIVAKRRAAKKLKEERKALQKDLQVWDNVSQVTADEAGKNIFKQNLSVRLKNIKKQFRAATEMLKQVKAPRKTPWFVLVGEPRSGKTRMLKNSHLKMNESAGETAEADTADMFSLSGWFSGNAFVLDISGRIFFDRWLGGSSAEWNLLLKLLKRKLGRKLLSGVILAIPADALLADDEEITRKKTALLVCELTALLKRLKLYVPCHVVITKMDLIPGFAEYFNELSDAQSEKVWGWRNTNEHGIFTAGSFSAYWKEMQNKLENGLKPALRSAKLFSGRTEISNSRMSVTGAAYIFPEELNKIRQNLNNYLEGIFGSASWMGNSQLLLSGVYFTSAMNMNVRLSKEFADLFGKKMDEAPLTVHHHTAAVRPYFIRQMLEEVIFNDTANSACTFSRKMWKYILLYLLAAALIYFTMIYCYHSTMPISNEIKEILSQQEMTYSTVRQYLKGSELQNSPIIVYDKAEQKYKVDVTSPIAGGIYPRYGFLSELMLRTQEKIPLQFGNYAASLLEFGDFNYDRESRDYVLNEVRFRMVIQPALKLMMEHCLSPEFKKEPYTLALRNVFRKTFPLRRKMQQSSDKGKVLYLGELLTYLIPDINSEHLNVFGSIIRYNNISPYISQSRIQIVDTQLRKVWNIACKKLLAHWGDLTIYPNSDFNGFCHAGDAVTAFSKNHLALMQTAEELDQGVISPGELQKISSRLQEQKKLFDEFHPYLMDFYSDHRNRTNPKPVSSTVAMLNLETNIRRWTNEFRKLCEEDREYLLKNADLLVGIAHEGEINDSPEISRFRDSVNDVFCNAEEKIKAKTEQINSIPKILARSELLTRAVLANPDKVVMRYEVIQEMTRHLDAFMESSRQMLSNLDSKQKYDDELDRLCREKIVGFKMDMQQYSADESLKPLIAAYQKIMFGIRDSMKSEVRAKMLAKYPKTVAAVLELVRNSSRDDLNAALNLQTNQAGDYFGVLQPDKGFDPRTVKNIVEPVKMILEDTKTVYPQEQKKELEEIKRVLNDYYADYMDYWTAYVDKIPVPAGNWKEFAAATAKYNAYHINSLLKTAYQKSQEIIGDIPDVLLNETNRKKKSESLAKLETRIQNISQNYMDLCALSVEHWKNLPLTTDAILENMLKLSAEQVKLHYLPLLNYNEKTGIPWWNRYITSGMKYLRQEVQWLFLEKYKQISILLYRFPMCRDSYSRQALLPNELESLASYLRLTNGIASITSDIQNSANDRKKPAPAEKKSGSTRKPDGAEAVFAMVPPEFLNPHIKECLYKQQLILDALTGRGTPLLYTLTLPPLEQQQKLSNLMALQVPLAGIRYPYAAVFSSQEESGVVSTRPGKELELLSAPAQDAELSFRFLRQEYDSQASAVNFSGPWCMLRIYLQAGSYYDLQKKTLYAPLFVTGPKGDKSVLWIGCKFNKQLPLPEEWPSSGTIPVFSEMQQLLTGKQLKSEEIGMTLLGAGPGEKGYSELCRKISRHDDGAEWQIKLTPITDTRNKVNAEAALQFPYLRIWADNRRYDLNLRKRRNQPVILKLNDGRLRFELRRYLADKEPAMTYLAEGLYPTLRIFCLPDKKNGPGRTQTALPFTGPDGGKKLYVTVELIPEQNKEEQKKSNKEGENKK